MCLVGGVSATDRDSAAVAVDILWSAVNWTTVNESIQPICRCGAAAIGEAVVASTELILFRRVDVPHANSGPMDLQRVAVDHTGSPRQLLGAGRAGDDRNGDHGNHCQPSECRCSCHSSPGHQVDGGTLAEILFVRRATRWLRLYG